ncbi:TIR domain-containing protein [Flavobacterium taihuense]|uniref:TIR domain-containing protein n=1 Tax=Flavobacterium taihuense TaxID=2857508 RepID=A0ABS6XRQ7_9FLAO|nr:TIR domain-containing protein [Flavobacterium taihuense]MBW4359355.1 TIR domain-containing protein [Flavobacterium taihuense]
MTRKIFTSFHYVPDNWRASQIRSMGKLEGSSVATANKWEEVTNGGNKAIEKWIDDNMSGKSCIIVFVGENTANRKWINYEIKKAWDAGRGVFGIYVHNLKDSNGEQSEKGDNPFEEFTVDDKSLSSIVKCYNPPYSTSTYVYDHIKENIEDWIEKAIEIRNQH